MKMAVLLVTAPCSLLEVHRCFIIRAIALVEAASTSEMTVSFYQTAGRNNPDDRSCNHLIQ
jgi:hypothetical protein